MFKKTEEKGDFFTFRGKCLVFPKNSPKEVHFNGGCKHSVGCRCLFVNGLM